MSPRTISTRSPASGHVPAARGSGLPVTRDLTFAYALSSAIALLVAVAAFGGLLFRHTIYPSDELIKGFLPVDVFHLVAGLPVLLGAMWLARRGRLIGLLSWPGSLLFLLYSYVSNLIGVPFGALFLPYLLLVTLSAYTLIGLIASIDSAAVRRRLEGHVPARAAGGLLAVLTGLFILLAVGGIASALVDDADPGPLELMLWIADLGTIAPACLAGGVLLWRREALGYVAGAALLLAYAMLFVGLVPVMIFSPLYDGSPLELVGIAMMLALGLACLALYGRFARGARAPGA
jgi:hypothetical protein